MVDCTPEGKARPDIADLRGPAVAGVRAARRVLVIDDNADSRESVSALVESWGHRAASAADGASALTVAVEFRPHVVLLDIGLPDVDGYEVARRLRALPGFEGLRVIAITGYGRECDRRASRESGIDEHLVKPVDLNALERLLARLPGGGEH